jgi:hypothetical protein
MSIEVPFLQWFEVREAVGVIEEEQGSGEKK